MGLHHRSLGYEPSEITTSLLHMYCFVVPQGFEPRQTVPKTVVLPLHNRTFYLRA